jgi:Ca-activated chloride channel family protein
MDRICMLILCLGVWRSLPAQMKPVSITDAQTLPIHYAPNAIRISTDLVTVPVSVTDTSGATVTDLEKEDFQIEEDGKPESILTLIKAGQSPLQLTLILDLSGSVQSNFEFEQKAASRFLEKIWKQGDSVSIISVHKQPEVCIGSSVSLEEALKVVSELQPTEDATAFFDSVVMASRILTHSTAPNTRQAMVIFSDGEDNRSDCGFPDALNATQRSNTVVYSINPSGPSIRLNEISIKGQEWLVSLAGKTGGAAFVSDQVSDLDNIYERIAVELRSLYLMSYYSSNTHADGRFRRISVSIPGKPELRVRAREGYYAIQESSELRE